MLPQTIEIISNHMDLLMKGFSNVSVLAEARIGADRQEPIVQFLISFRQINLAQPLFPTHNENNQDILTFEPIEYSAGWYDNLPIGQMRYFRNPNSGFWESRQTLACREHSLHIPCGSIRLVEGNILGNGFQVGNCRLGPDQASHRFIRFLANSWLNIRPCWNALSPRAMPSRICMRACCSS